MREETKEAIMSSLVPFRSLILSNDESKELKPAAFHYALSDLLLHGEKHAAVEMFRESGKSSYALRAFPLFCLAFPEAGRSFIVIIKQNQRQASAKLRDIISEFRVNPLLERRCVKVNEESMNAFSVDVLTADGQATRNVRIEAYGKGSGIRGLSSMDRRPDIVIMDDIQDENDSRSETVLTTDWDWFLSDVVFLGKSSRIFLIGNNLGERCVIERVIVNAERLGFEAIRVPVIKDGVPAWPAHDTAESIVKEREDYRLMGKLDIWMAEKMCQAVAEESRIFNPDDYRYYASSQKEEIMRRCNIFAALDPASSTNPEACYRAIVVVGVDSAGNWFLFDCKYGRWDSQDTVNVIFDTVLKYRLRDFSIEKGWWEQVMRPFLMEEQRRRNVYFNVNPLEHAKQGSKLERIKILQPRFRAHSVYFPEKAEWLSEFTAEMAGVTRDAIKSEYIDCVDALAMIEQVAQAPNWRNNYDGLVKDSIRAGRGSQASSSFALAGY